MTVDISSVAVLVSLAVAAWISYLSGIRATSAPAALVLLALPVTVWLGSAIWLYGVLDEAGAPRLLGAVPPVVTYLGVLWVAYRGIGGATYRVGQEVASFGRQLATADNALLRAFQDRPPIQANGMIDADALRARLERALSEFRTLDTPAGQWKALVDERAELHEEYIAIITSPTPVGPDVTDPLNEKSHAWIRAVQALTAEDEGRPTA